MLSGNLTVSVTDDGVQFSYTIENTSSDPVTANYRDGQKFEIVVEQSGEEVWRWSHGRMFTMALEETTFEPGKTITHEATWEDAGSGEYTATATCAANQHDARATVTFSV